MKKKSANRLLPKISVVVAAVLLALMFATTTQAENITLKLLKTEYDFDHVCDYYEITANELISSFTTPTVTSRTLVKGNVTKDTWEIQKTRVITSQIANETVTCKTETYSKNSSEYQNCTTKATPYNVSRSETYWTNDFTNLITAKNSVLNIRYCGQIKRQYVKGVGWTIQLDNIPTILGKEYPEYAWWNDSFRYRINFSINTTVNKPLINFTAKVVLNTSALISAGKLKSDCSDLRIVLNESISLPYEIESLTCNTQNTIIFFLIPYAYPYVNNFSFYYGNNATLIPVNSRDAWAGYNYVFHFYNISDSRVNATLSGKVGNPLTLQSGVYGYSMFFNGSTDGYRTNWTGTGGGFFYSIWIKADTTQPSSEPHFFSSINVSTQPNIYSAMYSGDFYSSIKSGDGTQIFNSATATGLNWLGKGWVYYAVTINSTNENLLYINGTFWLNNSYAGIQYYFSTNTPLGVGGKINTGGNFQADRFFRGYIDELRISNSYKPPHWLIAEFKQTYTVNYEEGVSNQTFFYFVSQIPSDITSTNLLNNRLNITYRINFSEESNVSNSTVLLFYKTNTSASDCLYYVNGTNVCGWRNTSYNNATLDLYTWSLGDAKVYPHTENIEFQDNVRNVEHIEVVSLTNSNQQALVEIMNLSLQQYNYVEVNVNSTLNNPIPVYLCNKNYAFSSSITTNPNCVQFATIVNPQAFNHTHNASVVNASRHHVLPLLINTTTYTIQGIQFTSTVYIGFVGQNGNKISLWGVRNVSRAGATKLSSNNGNSFSNVAGTVDLYISQFSTNTTFYYYTVAESLSGIKVTSEIKYDNLDLTLLPPTPPNITSPSNSSYAPNTIIPITYTPAISLNNLSIIKYSIAYYNETYGLKGIIDDNVYGLSSSWDTVGVPENYYVIGVTAYDEKNQTAIGFSRVFYLGTTTTTTTTIPTTSYTYIPTTTTTLPAGAVATNKTLYIYSIMLPIFAFISTIAVFYFSQSRIKETITTLTDIEGASIPSNILDKTTYLLQPLLPLISSLLWFESAFTTINIKFIGDFTTTASPYYIAGGNWEIGLFFSGLGVIIGIYFLFTVLSSARQSGIIKGGVR